MNNSDVIDKWLNATLSGKEQTKKRRDNRAVFEDFLKYSQKTAKQILDGHQNFPDKEFKATYEQLLLSFTKHLQKIFSPHEVEERVDIVRSFFSFYKLSLVFGLKAHFQFFFK